MDNLTHSLTAVLLSRAGFNRLSPHSIWILLLAANAPDIDIVASLRGPLTYLKYHRDITHSLIAVPILALIVILMVWPFGRKGFAWRSAYTIALAGVASHVLLDLMNAYGVRLLAPFSERWFHLDAIYIVDLWIWALLLFSLLAPVLGRLVSSEIGAASASGQGFAIFALVFMLLYISARAALHTRAMNVLESRLYGGVTPKRVGAFAGPANPFRWRGIVETDSFYSLQNVDLLADFDASNGRVFYKPEPNPAMQAASNTGVFREFLRFSEFPLWSITPVAQPKGGQRISVMDLRFGSPPSESFVATAIVDSRLKVVRAWFHRDCGLAAQSRSRLVSIRGAQRPA